MPQKWFQEAQKKHHAEHRRRLESIQPYVDCSKPRTMIVSKKKEIERKRYLATIERGNRLLLDRLGKAMDQKNIDNELERTTFISLQEQHRKRELERITLDNHNLLRHIQETEPMYSRLEWEKDCLRHEAVRKNMTEFPDYYKPAYVPSKMLQRLQAHAASLGPRGSVESPGRLASLRYSALIEPPLEEELPSHGMSRPSTTGKPAAAPFTHFPNSSDAKA